jgi:hypothetical protein
MSSTSRVRSVPAVTSAVVGMRVVAVMVGRNRMPTTPGWK